MGSSYTATVKGGFWEQYGTSTTNIGAWSNARRRIAQAFDNKGLLELRARARALNGVVAGSPATKTYGRIANSTELGGKRTVESETLINRVTTAGDVTEINDDIFTLFTSKTTFGSSPPANKDGNPLGTR